MDPRAHLTTLPFELIAKIMDDPDLKHSDVCALRLTCKHTYHFATELLVKTKSFVELPVLMSEYSLQTFVGICNNHALGSLVRKVRFSSLRINTGSLPAHAGETLTFTGRETTRAAIYRCKQVEACLGRYREEIALKSSGKVITQLLSGFQLLARYGNQIQISVSDIEDGSLGPRQSFSDYSSGASKLWSNDYQNALRDLTVAAGASGCDIGELALEIDRHRGPELIYYDNSTPEQDIQAFWNELKTVRFEFLTGKPSRPCIRKMEYIVSQTKHLENLHYSENDGRLSFSAIAKAITTESLKQLHVQQLGTVAESLMRILRQNRNSITVITMVDCQLSKGSWDSVLAYVRDNLPSLECLKLENLSYTYNDVTTHGTLFFEGRDHIRSGLSAVPSAARNP